MQTASLLQPGYGHIAQLAEQLTLNQRVLGSNPSVSTIPFRYDFRLHKQVGAMRKST